MLLRRIKLGDPTNMDKYIRMAIVNFNFENSLKQNMKMKNMYEWMNMNSTTLHLSVIKRMWERTDLPSKAYRSTATQNSYL